jgi:hypothetical protein
MPNKLTADAKLTQHRFETPQEKPQEPRTTPDDANSCWKKPGPVAGPFKAKLGDGSTVTYYWYRFADQPAMLNADLTPEEREQVQQRVEKLHRAWTKDRDYLTPPDLGKLADIDPALHPHTAERVLRLVMCPSPRGRRSSHEIFRHPAFGIRSFLIRHFQRSRTSSSSSPTTSAMAMCAATTPTPRCRRRTLTSSRVKACASPTRTVRPPSARRHATAS